jgi:hypothetical protein
MKPQHPIPENEQDNFVSLLWQILLEVESSTGSRDFHKKTLVEGGYKLLHRCGHFKNMQPCWAQGDLIKSLIEKDAES